MRFLRAGVVFFGLVSSAVLVPAISAFSAETATAVAFPQSPDPSLTPGDLCDKPDSKRYPEGIAYCSRSVGGDTKKEVMQEYDSRLGYQVTQMSRSVFKIDHFIPLCMGGSNDKTNLWPQHETVYKITDPLEPLACDKMAAGKLKQADAVALIRQGKLNLSDVPEVLNHLKAL